MTRRLLQGLFRVPWNAMSKTSNTVKSERAAHSAFNRRLKLVREGASDETPECTAGRLCVSTCRRRRRAARRQPGALLSGRGNPAGCVDDAQPFIGWHRPIPAPGDTTRSSNPSDRHARFALRRQKVAQKPGDRIAAAGDKGCGKSNSSQTRPAQKSSSGSASAGSASDVATGTDACCQANCDAEENRPCADYRSTVL